MELGWDSILVLVGCWLWTFTFMALCLSFLSVYHNSYPRGLLGGQKVAGKDSEHTKCLINATCSHPDLEGFEDPGECTQ